MRKFKTIIASLIVTTLLVGSVTVSAATGSPSKTPIDPAKSKIDISSSTDVAYSGKAQSSGLIVLVVDGKTLVEGVDYIVTYDKAVTGAGTYDLVATIKGIGHYSGEWKTKVRVVVNKKKQVFKKKSVKNRKVKRSKLKKKRIKIKLKPKTNGKGKLVFKRVSKKIKVSKKGVVTLKRGLKKGTYKVKVMAKATKNYTKTKWKTIKIKVK